VRQVGYLQGLDRDAARSTEHKIQQNNKIKHVVSNFRRDIDKICALIKYNAA
jgi:hypothetical protein